MGLPGLTWVMDLARFLLDARALEQPGQHVKDLKGY